jgi:galactose mutarotase-like enzyme
MALNTSRIISTFQEQWAMLEIRDNELVARIDPFGAELRHLVFRSQELIWTPRAELWNATSPILFPITGRVVDDVVRVGKTPYPMPMHGFAMTSQFETISHTDEACVLELRSNAATHVHYPFDFTLRITYRIANGALTLSTEIINDGLEILPASLGIHPGFRWPLINGTSKDDYRLTFEEAGPIAYTRPADGFVVFDSQTLALSEQSFALHEGFFTKSGFSLPELKSTSLRYHLADGRAGLKLDFPGFNRIIVWSKADGEFICIEPLYGHADPVGFAGTIMEKPGMAHIPPGETLKLDFTITPEFSPA